MNLYLISQEVNVGWDTYDSAVVAAESEEAARLTHPNESYYEFDSGGVLYFKYKDGPRRVHQDCDSGDWCAPEQVKVQLIGVYAYEKPGVICASFNAG